MEDQQELASFLHDQLSGFLHTAPLQTAYIFVPLLLRREAVFMAFAGIMPQGER